MSNFNLPTPGFHLPITSQFGLFTPRVLLAFALCSFGVLLGMFSLAATPLSLRAVGSTEQEAELASGAEPTARLPARQSVQLEESESSPSRKPVETTRAHTSVPLASAQGDWSIVNSSNTNATENYLLGVACVSASNCWTVGYSKVGLVAQTLIEHWDGTSWAIVTSPNALTAQNFLYGVTCVSASECWAVGYYINGTITSTSQTLIERWDGTSWAIVSSSNTSATQDNLLYGVTCVSASECWAVGYHTNDSFYAQTLAEHWDGSSWTIVTSPNASTTQANFLYGVTCVSASECWAVGYIYTNGGITFQTLIERWNGTSWTIVSSPNTSAAQTNVLYGVTCASASDCWAVGDYMSDSAVQTLIERWDGTTWAIVSSPNTSTAQTNVLKGVTCVSVSECWAVGYYINANGTYQTLIERWNGASLCPFCPSWAIVSSPNISSTQFNLLDGVTCISASECWAVGYYATSTAYQTLTEHYVASPPPIPTSVVSRKTHGTVGDFDIDLPLIGNPGIECRAGGTNNDYQVFVTFASAVTFNNAAVTSGTGTVSSATGSGTTAVTVNLTGVTNAQTITLTLSGVNDGTTTGDIGIRMAVLIGDTTANGSVNSSDIGQAKANSGQTTTGANFRTDVTVNGMINSSDIGTVKANSGTALP